MKKPVRILAVSMLSLALLPFVAQSDESDDGATPEKRPEMTREERRSAWENLSDEEKQAKREQRKAKREQKRAEWEALTPEEQEAKREQRRQRMESMTPEQREAMQQRRQQRGGQRQNHGGKKGQRE